MARLIITLPYQAYEVTHSEGKTKLDGANTILVVDELKEEYGTTYFEEDSTTPPILVGCVDIVLDGDKLIAYVKKRDSIWETDYGFDFKL